MFASLSGRGLVRSHESSRKSAEPSRGPTFRGARKTRLTIANADSSVTPMLRASSGYSRINPSAFFLARHAGHVGLSWVMDYAIQ